MNATKFILFSLVFLCTAISQAITGHTYVLTGVYRPDSTSCDPAQLAVNRHYQASLGQEKPFFFMLDTVCFHMENGIYLEIQMLIEPRVKEEIPAVEKYVEELGYSKIAGMILQLQPLKQIIAHGRFQWIFEKGEEQDLKAEHEVAQIFYSYLEMQAERAKLTEASATWLMPRARPGPDPIRIYHHTRAAAASSSQDQPARSWRSRRTSCGPVGAPT